MLETSIASSALWRGAIEAGQSDTDFKKLFRRFIQEAVNSLERWNDSSYLNSNPIRMNEY